MLQTEGRFAPVFTILTLRRESNVLSDSSGCTTSGLVGWQYGLFCHSTTQRFPCWLFSIFALESRLDLQGDSPNEVGGAIGYASQKVLAGQMGQRKTLQH